MIVHNKKNETLEIKTVGLTEAQKRLLKSLNALLGYTIQTDDEAEFFNGSAEALRICASLIKQSHFIENLSPFDDIPYAEQALEYSIDVLQEHINASKVIQYDN